MEKQVNSEQISSILRDMQVEKVKRRYYYDNENGDSEVRVNMFMAELKSLMETHGVELLNEQIKLGCAGNVHDIKTVLTD